MVDGWLIAQNRTYTDSAVSKHKAMLHKLDIELTERCNNDCIHCFINLPADDKEVQQRELSTEEIKEIFREAASLGCLSIRFTGGEPLLRHDFEDLYLFARRLGLLVQINTNATLISHNLGKVFSKIPPLALIYVTVYGMKRESYEAVTRNPGSFEAAWQGINILFERKIPFAIRGALLPPNKEELAEFESWAARIPWMHGRSPSYLMFFNLRCRRDSEAKNRCIKKLRLSPKDGLYFLTRRKGEYIKSMQEFCSRFLDNSSDKLFFCSAGKREGCIDAYGSFQPCLMLRHPDTVYNYREGSIKEAITNFFPKIRDIRAENANYLARCAHCFLFGLCEQCPAKSWMEYGTLDSPVEYLCQMTHVQAEFVGLLKKGEVAWKLKDRQDRIDKFIKNSQF